MVEAQKYRIEQEMTKLINELDRTYLRKMQITMRLFNIRIFVTVAHITLISAFDPQQYALANALQTILSPANTEKALQIIQMAANRQMKAPCVEEKSPIPPAQAKRHVLPIGALQRITTPNGEQYYIKQTQHSQPNVPAPQTIEVVPSNPLPVQNTATIMSKFTMPNPVIVTRDVPQASVTKEVCPCGSQGLVNPFLPAASPISALSPPTSNLLPSAFPMQSRGHFLRKIPIPPPTL